MVTQGSGRKADQMGDHPARPDPAEPGPNEATWVFSDPDPAAWGPAGDAPRPAPSPSGSVIPPPTEVIRRPPAEPSGYSQTEIVTPPPAEVPDYRGPAAPPWEEMTSYPEAPAGHARTEVSGYPEAPAGHARTEVSGSPVAAAGLTRADAAPPPPGHYVRYGPGVPAAVVPPASAAERIWRTGPVPETPRRRPRWRRALGTALTVALLAVAAVILFLRLHHPALAVTAAAITEQTRNGCGVDVTGRITTSGGAGTVSYQWVFRPDTRPPQPLTQTVIAGQKAVFVTVAVEGSGRGSVTQSVTLQVLGPDQRAASTSVVIRC